jgi:uncharacterized iron-regulated membrane protein
VGAGARILAGLRWVHRWAGAFVCLILIVLGTSGTALVFRADWLHATVPGAADAVEVSPALAARAAVAAEGQLGADAVRSIVLAGPQLGVHTVALSGGGGAYLAAGGSLVTEWRKGGRADAWLFGLHHDLLSGDAGETAAGLAGLALVALCLTGLVVTLPGLRATLRASLVTAWPRSPQRRDLLAAHRGLGLVLAGPLVVVGLTGAAMVFDREARVAMNALAGTRPPHQDPITLSGTAPATPDWAAATAAAQAAFPDATLRVLVWPRSDDAPLQIRLRQPGEWHPNGRTTVWLDRQGRVLASQDGMTLPRGDRWTNALYPLHAAKLGEGAAITARIVDAVWAATGAGLVLMGVFGLWAFLVRPLRTPSRHRRRPGAQATALPAGARPLALSPRRDT